MFFDIIINLYNNAAKHEKETGSIPCVFEDGIEGSCTLSGDDIQQMLEFYGGNSQKEKARTALQLLKAITNQEASRSKNDNQNNIHLKDSERLALEDQAKQKQKIDIEMRSAAIKKWTIYCSR